MSFNKNNPNAMGKIMGYLKQLSTEMVSYSSEYKVTSNPKAPILLRIILAMILEYTMERHNKEQCCKYLNDRIYFANHLGNFAIILESSGWKADDDTRRLIQGVA